MKFQSSTLATTKSEGKVDHSTVTRWFKKFHTGRKDLNNQARSDRPKSMDSMAVLEAIEANLASNTWRVSDKLVISQSSVIHHLQ